jgi:hypothetical protein
VTSQGLRIVPWNKNNPKKLDARPNDPTITTSFAFEISIRAQCHAAIKSSTEDRTWRAEKPFNGLHENGEAKGQEKYAICESGDDFGTMPSV